MEYLSTRDKQVCLSGAEVIKMGLSRDGGLFVPTEIPTIGPLELEAMCNMSYQHRAAYIIGKFLEDYCAEELALYTKRAYGGEKFDSPSIAPIRKVDDATWCLELWHGPTAAFKDMALQLLPQLLAASLRKTGEERTASVLVATSGDTGKAAMEGFADVEQTRIQVFYPRDGVSAIQKLQMVTQAGKNVDVTAVVGNFDDAQTGVKRIFSDETLRKELDGRGYFLSSANSINWGRILPQVVYYISAYCDLMKAGAVKLGKPINVCVPTGNFGNILACWYAKKMGLPVKKLICASNQNNVLTEFIRTGVYDRNRRFYTTMSPSMDILVSSNLERLVYYLTGCDDGAVRQYMAELRTKGRYALSADLVEKLQTEFYGGFCSEEETSREIARMYQYGYLIDPHTAVAAKVLGDYRRETGDMTPAVFASTASPYKFCDDVLRAIGETPVENSLDRIEQLYDVTGVSVPKGLSELRGKRIRFESVVAKEGMDGAVQSFLQ